MDLARHFGEALRVHREQTGLSQEALAHRAGLDRTYVSGIERGRRNPTIRTAQRLADALGSGLDVMFATARTIATTRRRQA